MILIINIFIKIACGLKPFCAHTQIKINLIYIEKIEGMSKKRKNIEGKKRYRFETNSYGHMQTSETDRQIFAARENQ